MHSIIYRKGNAYNKGLFKNVVIKTGEVFAFISTIFISWCCNFTSSSTMHMKFSHILLTNLQKCLENKKIRVELNLPFFQKFLFDSLCSQKCIFLSIFRGWSIKYRKMCLLGHFSDKIGLFLFFLGHPVKVNLVGTNFSIHSQTNGTHFVLWTLLKNSQWSVKVTQKSDTQRGKYDSSSYSTIYTQTHWMQLYKYR